MMLKLLRPVALLALALASIAAQGEEKNPMKDPGVKHVDAKQAKVLVEAKKVVVLDIRTPEEFKEGHISGATNIDFNGPDFAKQVGQLDKSKSYLVHCAGGGRSTRSLPILKKLEFKSVYHLDGGFGGWADQGLPVEK